MVLLSIRIKPTTSKGKRELLFERDGDERNSRTPSEGEGHITEFIHTKRKADTGNIIHSALE